MSPYLQGAAYGIGLALLISLVWSFGEAAFRLYTRVEVEAAALRAQIADDEHFKAGLLTLAKLRSEGVWLRENASVVNEDELQNWLGLATAWKAKLKERVAQYWPDWAEMLDTLNWVTFPISFP
ncbi:MAG: hypothetical protein Q8Q12_08895 [bacterium]|nr:hypothetical protein [bacterium]